MLAIVPGSSMASACWNFCLREPVNSNTCDCGDIWSSRFSSVFESTWAVPFIMPSATWNWFFQNPIVHGCGFSPQEYLISISNVYVWHSCAVCSMCTASWPSIVWHGLIHMHSRFGVSMSSRASGFGFSTLTLSMCASRLPLFFIVKFMYAV